VVVGRWEEEGYMWCIRVPRSSRVAFFVLCFAVCDLIRSAGRHA